MPCTNSTEMVVAGKEDNVSDDGSSAWREGYLMQSSKYRKSVTKFNMNVE